MKALLACKHKRKRGSYFIYFGRGRIPGIGTSKCYYVPNDEFILRTRKKFIAFNTQFFFAAC